MRHLIFCDIDGTLMSDQQKISDQTIKYINTLEKQGHLFFLATGRMYLSAKKIANTISNHTGVIASNGGIYSLDEKKEIHTFDMNDLQIVYKKTLEYNIPLFLFTDHKIYYTLFLPDYFKNESDIERVSTGEQKEYEKINSIHDFMIHKNEYISAIAIEENKLNHLQNLKNELKLLKKLSISSSCFNNIEIMPLNISKATAISEIQNYYHIPPERTITFGDGDNDIEMFNVSQYSVAMDNANETVKKIAKFTTKSNNDEGVLHFLLNYFEGEK